jgi:hypothetical protein
MWWKSQPKQAAVRRAFYRANGYAVFRSVLPLAVLDALGDAIRTELEPYDGPLVRHYGEPASHRHAADGRILNAVGHPHLAPLPRFRKASLDAYCHRAVAECLRELDSRGSYAFQGAILFFVSPLTTLHDDSWSCDTFPHGGAFTVWIPLEDTEPSAGPPFVVSWPVDRFLTAADLGIEFPPEDTPGWSSIAQERYREALEQRVKRDGLSLTVPTLRRGDLIVWGSLTPHGSLPGHPIDRSRLSLQGIYRPLGVPWGAHEFESGKHRFGPPAREERKYNADFVLTLPPGMRWAD